MPSVELVNGKWVSVDGVKAEDLDGPAPKKPNPPTPAPEPVAKAPKVKAVIAKTPAGLTAKQQKEVTSPKTSA